MAGVATVPHTFGSDSGNVHLSDWDDDYNALLAYLNDPTNRISFGVDSGAANAYVLTPSPAIPNYTNPFIVWFVPAHSNTATSTANISGKGGLTIFKDSPAGPVALTGGEIIVANLCGLMLDPNLNSGAGGLHLLNPQGSAGTALRGYLAGCALSPDGVAPTTKIDASAGQVTDDTNATLLTFAAGAIDFTTNGAGGLDTGSLVANTWYHCFGIAQPNGTTNYFASTSPTPTLPGAFTLKRRLGSVKTAPGAATLLPFVQLGDYFYWQNPNTDDVNNSTQGATPTNYTVNSPLGVNVLAYVQAQIGQASGTQANCRVYDPALTDFSIASGNASPNVGLVANGNGTNALRIGEAVWARTNTSSQVRAVADATLSVFALRVVGWMDYRGRYV